MNRTYKIKRNYTQLGDYLKYGREKSDLTQREVGKILGYSSAQFISNFERGIAPPPMKKLKKLVKLYKLSTRMVTDYYSHDFSQIISNSLR